MMQSKVIVKKSQLENYVNMYKNVVYERPSKLSYFRKVVGSLLRWRVWGYFVSCLAYWLVNFVLPRAQIEKGKNTNVHPTTLLRHAERIVIGDNTLINHGNVIQAGKVNARILIGNFVHTGPNVMMFAYNHRFETGTPSKVQNYDEADIVIGDDVWIGAGSIILAGTEIENGVVIAAGSVVKGKLSSNSVYAGVPVKLIGQREKYE